MGSPILPYDAMYLVCSWRAEHDEAMNTLYALFDRGYRVAITNEPPDDGESAGILVLGADVPASLYNTPIEEDIVLYRWEIRELVLAVAAESRFRAVEYALSR